MTTLPLFFLLFILSFGVLLYFLRPTRTEKAVERQLEGIEGSFQSSASAGTILKEEMLSTVPWISSLLKEIPGTISLLNLVVQAGSNWKVGMLLLYTLLVAGLTVIVASLAASSFLAIISVGLVLTLGPYAYLFIMRMARFRRCDSLLPEAVDLMSRALKAGHTVTSALEMVGQEISDPLGAEFRTAYEAQGLGLPLREAILGMVQRLPLDDMRFLVTAILVQKETGGNLTQILDKVAAVMRDRARLRGQLRIYTAQGRITGWILCSLPFALFFLINLVNPDYESILFSDPTGLKLVYAGLAMMALGILAIRKIIDIRV
jgi:tight adherence protein B